MSAKKAETRGERFRRELEAEFDVEGVIARMRLDNVCRLLDRMESIEVAIEADGVTVEGSTGNRRGHPALQELRASELTLAKLLRDLGIEDEEETPAQTHGRRAANARWQRERQKLGAS